MYGHISQSDKIKHGLGNKTETIIEPSGQKRWSFCSVLVIDWCIRYKKDKFQNYYLQVCVEVINQC